MPVAKRPIPFYKAMMIFFTCVQVFTIIMACIMIFSAFNLGLPTYDAFIYAGRGMLGIGFPIAAFTYIKWFFGKYFEPNKD